MPVDSPMPPPPDSPQTIARQLPPTKRAIEARQGGWIDFLQGIPVLARFKQSVRVGSGSTTGALLDGHDGAIVADGALAALLTRDRADATKFLNIRKDTTVRVNTTEGGDIHIFDATTGIFTLAAATVVSTFTNSWVDAGGALSVSTVRYRKDLFGEVRLIGVIKSGTIGAAAFTLPTGFRPFSTLFLGGTDVGARTEVSIDVQAGGAVIPQTGTNTTGIAFNLTFPTVF